MGEQMAMDATASGRTTTQRGRVRHWAIAAAVGLLVGLVPTLTIDPASAVDGNQITEKLEGCRADATVYPEQGPFVCDDADYTTGNLGQGWNELDLVPHRLTTSRSSNSSTGTFAINIVADRADAGSPGYDFISYPVVKAGSHASCQVTATDYDVETPGVGGTEASGFRTLTITQAPNTTCTFDYYERLALGSHLYPGSSLHSNVTNEDFSIGGVGARDVSIPVKDILPQTIQKDMSATQGSSHVWNVTKEAQPATLHFEDTCSSVPGALEQGVAITVSWQKLPATPAGQVTIVTNVYATNPAHRPLLIDVTDVIYSGTDELDSYTFPQQLLPALSTTQIGDPHIVVIDAADAVDLNDIATGEYTDPVPANPPIDLSVEATASADVQLTGDSENDTATITDVESISGSGLEFSVDGFSGATGDYDDGYVEGTQGTDDVSWTSDPQSGDGSVTFNKTVYVLGPQDTGGTLTDTATLNGSDGFTDTADATVTITSDATTTLTINKSIENILQGAETVSFTFNVYENDTNTLVDSKVVTFTAGETSKSISFSLDPGVYDVTEDSPDGWTSDLDGDDVDLTLPTCSAALFVHNTPDSAEARVVKITDPVGSQGGWEMCLLGPGTPADPGECVTTDSAGEAAFTTPLQEGSYTITETPQSGFDQTDSDGCSFTVNFPEDFNQTFTCTITNTERGTVTVLKTSSGLPPLAGEFTFQIRTGASATEPGTVLATDTNDADGNVDFDTLVDGLAPGDYQICEADMLPGWHSTLSDEPGHFVPDADAQDPDNSVVCVPFTLEPGEAENFIVENTPPPGGDARTIGYWRNWSSCTSGNQDPVLDDTLASAGGILIGDLLVDTCQEAVAILSKSDLNGVKRASDPAFNMAAQLLAAFLNQEAGAGVCPAAATAMASGQTLLANADFDGYRTFGGSSTKGKKGSTSTGTIDGALANSLAGTLDAYNNNELC